MAINVSVQYDGVFCFVVPKLRVYARWSGWGGRFIPSDIVGVHTLSLLTSSRVALDRTTEHNHTQQAETTTPI